MNNSMSSLKQSDQQRRNCSGFSSGRMKREFSCIQEEKEEAFKSVQESIKQRKLEVSDFPQRLYEVVLSPANSNIIRWSSSGKSFIISDFEAFERKLLRSVLKQGDMNTFLRQLERFDFREIRSNSHGREFEHPMFHRNMPNQLAKEMKRKSKQPNTPYKASIMSDETIKGDIAFLNQKVQKFIHRHQESSNFLKLLVEKFGKFKQVTEILCKLLAEEANLKERNTTPLPSLSYHYMPSTPQKYSPCQSSYPYIENKSKADKQYSSLLNMPDSRITSFRVSAGRTLDEKGHLSIKNTALAAKKIYHNVSTLSHLADNLQNRSSQINQSSSNSSPGPFLKSPKAFRNRTLPQLSELSNLPHASCPSLLYPCEKLNSQFNNANRDLEEECSRLRAPAPRIIDLPKLRFAS